MGLAEPKMPVHQFQAILSLWARAEITGTEARDAAAFVSGPLDTAEVAEAQALVATVTSLAAGDARTSRAKRIDEILLLAESRCPPYDTAARVRTALGV